MTRMWSVCGQFVVSAVQCLVLTFGEASRKEAGQHRRTTSAHFLSVTYSSTEANQSVIWVALSSTHQTQGGQSAGDTQTDMQAEKNTITDSRYRHACKR